MPLYEYVCTQGHTHTLMRSIADRREPLICAACNKPMTLAISPVAGTVRNPAVPKRI